MKKILLFLSIVLIMDTLSSQIVKTQVGMTSFDLQTNGSMARRVTVDPVTGRVRITYTGADSTDTKAGNFPSRGTGYYTYSGTGPVTPQLFYPGRIEKTKRVGWANPVLLAGTREAVFAHVSENNNQGLHMTWRNLPTDTWTTQMITPSGAETWCRAASSGDSIIVVSSVFAPSNFFGMTGGLGMKRSFDGGKTWIPDALNGMDTIGPINDRNYPNQGTQCAIYSDEYAIDAKAKKIAILTGGVDVSLISSNDFGNTWTRRVIIAGNNNTDVSHGDDFRNNGDFSVLIDNNNVTHCFWSLNYTDTFASISFTPSGIMYWNENMTEPYLIGKTAVEKEQSIHSQEYLGFATVSRSPAPASPSTRFNAYVGSTFTCYPTSGVDANNNLYLSFMRVRGVSDTNRVANILDASGQMYSDVYLIKSTNGGKTWEGPLNVSNTDSMEEAFPSIARHVNSDVHMVYMQDELVGIVMADNVISHNDVTTKNKMIYAKVPVADISSKPDNMPPLLLLNGNYAETFQSDSVPLRFSFYVGCRIEIKTGLNFGNLTDFAKKYIAWAIDDITDTGLIRVDTTGVNFNQPGNYKFRIYAKDASGKVSTKRQTFTYPTLSSLNIVSHDTLTFDIQILPALADYKPINNGFTGNPPITNKYINYWYLGTPYTSIPSASWRSSNPCGGGNITLSNPTISDIDVNTPGKQLLIYKATQGAAEGRDTITYFIGKEPKAGISDATMNGNKLTAKGDETTDTFTWAPTTYQWKYREPTTPIKYTNFTTGGTSKNITNLNVTKPFTAVCLEAKNLFNNSPFNKKADTFCYPLKYTVSIKESYSNDFNVEIFPNPSSGKFFVRLPDALKGKEVYINIYDMTGKMIYRETAKTSTGEIPISDSKGLSIGNYILKVSSEEKASSHLIEIK